MLGIEKDYDLTLICDWQRFEEKVCKDEKLKPPSFFLDEIHNEEWNNIPIPLVDGIATIKTSLLNLEHLFLHMCKETKYKTEQTAKKLFQI